MSELNFDNRFVRELPGDAESSNTPRQVHGAAYTRVAPTAVAAPRLLAWSREVAADLGLAPADVASPDFAAAFAGNRLWPGMEPYAAAYGGHQFGQWAGQLGDGRAIGLGEVIGADGRRHELQLKGAGPTPYSRRADGRAVLRSSLREFLCSEAMHHLGVPTTRALCLVGTGEQVIRDMFYDGRPEAEPGAIVCRVAPSFIRFGNFELPASRGDTALLGRLIDFTIARDYPHLAGADARIAWFHEIATRTAEMVAHWMRVGFVHGVMNTDNMSILGLTIDYGPYGWLEEFDPDWTPNTTDAGGRRYAFGRQPAIAQWNLQCLAGALATVVPDHDGLRAGLAAYADAYADAHARMTAAKLGFADWRDGDDALARDLFRILGDGGFDYILYFRALAQIDVDAPSPAPLEHACYDARRRDAVDAGLRDWLARWAARVRSDAEPAQVRRARMDAANPLYVPRNWMAQQAIDAATVGDSGELETLHELLRRPYEAQPGMERYAARRPDWARDRAGCSMLSCSS
jgi:uncharacterized protein YdiU (UPF0061 family)